MGSFSMEKRHVWLFVLVFLLVVFQAVEWVFAESVDDPEFMQEGEDGTVFANIPPDTIYYAYNVGVTSNPPPGWYEIFYSESDISQSDHRWSLYRTFTRKPDMTDAEWKEEVDTLLNGATCVNSKIDYEGEVKGDLFGGILGVFTIQIPGTPAEINIILSAINIILLAIFAYLLASMLYDALNLIPFVGG